MKDNGERTAYASDTFFHSRRQRLPVKIMVRLQPIVFDFTPQGFN